MYNANLNGYNEGDCNGNFNGNNEGDNNAS